MAGSAFAVGEPASRKVPARVKANKASAPAGRHRPSLGRSHVFYLLAALHLCVSAVAGYSHAAGAAALNATAPNLTALNSTGEYGNHKASDDQPARSNLFAPLSLEREQRNSDSGYQPYYGMSKREAMSKLEDKMRKICVEKGPGELIALSKIDFLESTKTFKDGLPQGKGATLCKPLIYEILQGLNKEQIYYLMDNIVGGSY